MARALFSRPQDAAASPSRRPAPAKFALAWLPLLLVFGLLLLLTAGPAGAQTTTNDYDSDDDNLLEVNSQAQLRAALRWDLNGDGTADGGEAGYSNAFPNPATNMCPATCAGYELSGNLTFTGNWTPYNGYSAILEGNGYSITGLTVNLSTASNAGLITYTGSSATIRNLGFVNPSITSTNTSTNRHGVLAGEIRAGSVVSAVYVSGGSVTSSANNAAAAAGGLTGRNQGTIRASWSSATVATAGNPANGNVGGLVGDLNGGTIIASYATGTVTPGTGASVNNGLLVGRSANRSTTTSTITNSYCAAASGDCIGAQTGGAVAATRYTATQMQTPTGYTGIYLNWNIDLETDGDLDYPWNFGTSSAYPTLNTPDQRDTATPSDTDYDADDDGLIEISTAAQLNAVRWNLDGDGDPDTANYNAYGTAFGGRQHTADSVSHRMGCPLTTPTAGCVGYELTAAISLSDYANWAPIGTYTATFDGNGHAITNLTITNATADDVGLFSRLDSSTGIIRRVAVTGAAVSGNATSSQELGILVGEVTGGTVRFSYTTGSIIQNGQGAHNKTGGLVGFLDSGGRIDASYSTAAVTGNSGGAGITTGVGTGGLVGKVGDNAVTGSTSYVRASYASGAVTAGIGSTRIGGLVGFHANGTIDYSYAYGAVSTTGTSTFLGGLVGDRFATLTSVTASYYDGGTTGQSDTGRGTSQTTTQLQGETSYGTGIYANWNTNVDGVAGNDDPWDFGTASQYPALKVDFNNDGTDSAAEFGGQGRGTDYDTDNNGLIEIASAAQLNAIRYDIDGDGTAQTGSETDYAGGFPSPLSDQCDDPATTGSGNVETCAGYELTANLNLATDYPTWTPIGSSTLWFRTTFDGNGHTISGVNVTSGSTAGLFGYIGQFSGTTGVIRNLGVLNAAVSAAAANDSAGAIVGVMATGTLLHSSFASGGTITANAATTNIGGLVGGVTGGTIRASYSTNAVTKAGAHGSVNAGGLVGVSTGTIVASYAAGAVTGTGGASNNYGGLLGRSNTGSTITDSYCDSAATTQTNCIGSSASGVTATSMAYTTAQLQMPTGYTAGSIYADWDVDADGDTNADDPWDFGTASQYPALKFDTDGNGTPTAYEFGVQGRPNPNPDPAPQPGGGSQPVARGGGQPYHPASAHPEIYTNPRHEMAVSCALKTTGTGDEAQTTSTMTFDLGTYTRPITLVLSLWDGQFFRTLQSQNIPMPTLQQDGQTATVEVVTDPTQTRFRIDSEYGLNLVLGYADCRTDDP